MSTYLKLKLTALAVTLFNSCIYAVLISLNSDFQLLFQVKMAGPLPSHFQYLPRHYRPC